MATSDEMRAIQFMFFLIITIAILPTLAFAVTKDTEVAVLHNMYTSLNSPIQLSGWKAKGGDPCTDAWKGVVCSGSSITKLILSGLELNGNLGYQMNQLTSLQVLDMSNNKLTGNIPYQIPPNLQRLNLAQNEFSSGSLPYSLNSMHNLTYLNVANNQISGNLNDIFQNLGKLTYLDFSSNHFSGSLPHSFSSLSSLTTLHLQSNHFSGNLNILNKLTSLKDVNVAHNNFDGWIPEIFSRIPILDYGNNNFNNGASLPPLPYSPPPILNKDPHADAPSHPASGAKATAYSPGDSSSSSQTPLTNNKTSLSGGAVGGIVVAGIVGAIALGLAMLFFRSKKMRKRRSIILNGDGDGYGYGERHIAPSAAALGPLSIPPPMKIVKEKAEMTQTILKPPPEQWHKNEIIDPRKISGRRQSKHLITAIAFSVAELEAATKSFSRDNLIGEGEAILGHIYRADMPNGKVLAVKKMDSLPSSALEKEDNFMDTVSKLSCLRHANIAELVGYCKEQGKQLLVYNYFKKGTLHHNIHASTGILRTPELVWTVRVKIALGMAQALEYLHEVCKPAIVHKNFKSSSILLDDDFNPRLAMEASFTPTLDPQMQGSSSSRSATEYAMPAGNIHTTKSDIYSFGIVMLELLTGHKPLDSSRPRSEQSLVRWATPQLHDIDALANMADPLLHGMYPPKSLSRFADIIALCVQPEPEFRPPMSEVVQSLVQLEKKATMNQGGSGEDKRDTDIISNSSM